jgi:hypothetical protein
MMNRYLNVLILALFLSGCGRATVPAPSPTQEDGEALSKEAITSLLQNESLNPEGVARINAKLKQEGEWRCMLHPHAHNEYGTCSAVSFTNDTWAIEVRKIAQANGTHELKITYNRKK